MPKKNFQEMSKRELACHYHDHDLVIDRILPFICAGNSDSQAENWKDMLEDELHPEVAKIFRDKKILMPEDQDEDKELEYWRLADAVGQSDLIGFLVEYSIPVYEIKKSAGKELVSGSRGYTYPHWIYVEELNQAGLARIAEDAMNHRENQLQKTRKKLTAKK